MSDNIDKKLVNRINQVFENYEDDTAVEGWEKLLERFPGENKRRPVIYWISSAAAILLILSGIWYFSESQQSPENLNAKIIKQKLNNKSEDNSSAIASEQEDSINNSDDNIQEIQSQNLVLENAKSDHRNKVTFKRKIQRIINESIPNYTTEEFTKLPNEEAEDNLTLFALSPKDSKKPDTTTVVSMQNNSIKTEDLTGSNASNTAIPTSETITENKNISSTSVKDEQLITATKNPDTKKDLNQRSKNVIFGIFGGSYMNYSNGSNASINTSMGVTTDIKISKKLKIATGISVGQNSLKFTKSLPQQAASNFNKTSSSGKAEALRNNSNNSNYYNTNSLALRSYTINTYSANLKGLDIPINLKYSLRESIRSIYVVAGFSSNYFLNESYTYGFNYLMNTSVLNDSNSLNQQKPTETTRDDFHSFDFARMLNLSFGFEYPVSKHTRLSLEPFVKYPLSGIGAHDLRFGSAGMNLKMNFNRQK